MRLRVLVLVALLGIPAGTAEARLQRDVRYRYEQVWNALVRLLRVDRRFPIDESDRDNGFVLFRYREYGRDHAASVEVIRVDTDGGELVRIVVNVDGVPSDTEIGLGDALEEKLRTDFGPPRPPPAVATRERAPLVPRLSPSRTDGAEGVSPNPDEEPPRTPSDGLAPNGSPLPRAGAAAREGRSGSSGGTGDGTVSPSDAQPEFPPPSSRRTRRR